MLLVRYDGKKVKRRCAAGDPYCLGEPCPRCGKCVNHCGCKFDLVQRTFPIGDACYHDHHVDCGYRFCSCGCHR